MRAPEPRRDASGRADPTITDGLTGIANRGAFEETIKAAVSHALRHARPLSLVMPDLNTPQQLVKAADARLYDAKRDGRNRVAV